MSVASAPVALITGASSGIGAAFARALAARGYRLILVARRETALIALGHSLSTAHGLPVEVFAADLGAPGAAERLGERVEAIGWPLDLLINNAGVGMFGPFSEADPGEIERMLALNVGALTAIARRFLPAMLARRRGAIINVASVAAFQGVPCFAAYAASKAYVLSLSEALAEEAAPSGVLVQALCPGTTRSEFFDVAKMHRAEGRMMPAEAVVEAALAGVAAGRRVVVPGAANWVAARLGRWLPRAWLTKLAGRAVR